VVPPPDGVKSDLEILQELGERLGVRALEGSAREWKKRILRRDSGLTVEQLEEEGPQRHGLAPKVLFAERKFRTATGKMNLLTGAPATDLGGGGALYGEGVRLEPNGAA